MRHQNQLVCSMEVHERAQVPAAAEQAAKPPVGEYALDEVLPQPRIRQAPFLFDRKRRKPFDETGREYSAAGFFRPTSLAVDLDAVHAAAWRILLEHVAAQLLGVERG